MGFFDNFKKKEKNNTAAIENKFSSFKSSVLTSYGSLQRDIDIHNQWISYLNGVYSILNDSHVQHRSLTNKEMDDLKKWISYFNQNNKNHIQTIANLNNTLSQAIKVYDRNMLDMYKRITELERKEKELKDIVVREVENKVELGIEKKHSDTEAIIEDRWKGTKDFIEEKIEKVRAFFSRENQKIAELVEKRHEHSKELINESQKSVRDMIDESHKTAKEMISESHKTAKDMIDKKHTEVVKTIDNIHQKINSLPVRPQQQVTTSTGLTNPEQKLLNLLLSKADPVSYSFLSEQTGNSINTVRVIMNNLKKRGLVIENILPSGVKLFSATDKEKIKKLYNLGHI